MYVDGDLDLLAEIGKDHHQPVDREAAEISVADAGEVCGGDAGHFVRGAQSVYDHPARR